MFFDTLKLRSRLYCVISKCKTDDEGLVGCVTLNIQDTKQTRSFKEPHTISNLSCAGKFRRAVVDNCVVYVSETLSDVVAVEGVYCFPAGLQICYVSAVVGYYPSLAAW